MYQIPLHKMREDGLRELSDNDLIDRIKSGDSYPAFQILYKRYYTKVLNKCYSLTRNRKTSEELTEDIFSRVYEKLPTFKQLSSFSSWLYSITYNHSIDYLRVKKKLHYPEWNRENSIPEILDENEEIPEEIDFEKLMGILELIHPEEKALLFMKYREDLSLKQIGSALRISEDAAKMRLKRARARVRYLYTQKYLNNK